MASSAQRVYHHQMSSLFVGDLSIFCTEADLQGVFSQFDIVDDVKIIRCEATHKNLCYGFVKLASQEGAASAMAALDGTLLCGRPLRIRWAAHKTPGTASLSSPTPTEAFTTHAENSAYLADKPATASIHITYMSNNISQVITEARLQAVFRAYGEVIDIIIKKFEVNDASGWQRGYGFVHFAATPEGIAASLSCVMALRDAVLEDVHYKCSISHKLEALLRERKIPYESSLVDHTPFASTLPLPLSMGMTDPSASSSSSSSSTSSSTSSAHAFASGCLPHAAPPMMAMMAHPPVAPDAFGDAQYPQQYYPYPVYSFVPAWTAYDPARGNQLMIHYAQNTGSFHPSPLPMPATFYPMMMPSPVPPSQGYPWSPQIYCDSYTREGLEPLGSDGELASDRPMSPSSVSSSMAVFSAHLADEQASRMRMRSTSRAGLAQGFKGSYSSVLVEHDYGTDRDDNGPPLREASEGPRSETTHSTTSPSLPSSPDLAKKVRKDGRREGLFVRGQ